MRAAGQRGADQPNEYVGSWELGVGSWMLSGSGVRRFPRPLGGACRLGRLGCLGRGPPLLGGLGAELLGEAFHASFGVDQLLAPREERVAHRADLEVQLGLGGPRPERVAAGTAGLDFVVLRVYPFLHNGSIITSSALGYDFPAAIAARNSAFVLVLLIFDSSSSIASVGESGVSTFRSTQTRLSSSLGSSSSSFRVPLLLMSIDGNTRRSVSFRSRWTSMLPVPLNSSKITSSILEPVSTSAVATMVSEPPSSMQRAAPKKRFGRWSALLSTPPESTLPEAG